jgi:CubicO group peptidase (beta-lactamase class C family)
MDSAQFVRLLEFVAQENLLLHSISVIRNGYLVLDAYVAPFAAGARHEVHSVTKSLTSALIGIALAEGALPSVDQPLLEIFAGRAIANRDSRKDTIRLADLLKMASGLNWPEEGLPYSSRAHITRAWLDSVDPVQFVLDRPMLTDPGTAFNYNSGGSHLLSAALQQATGQPALEYARSKLLAPMGIHDVVWASDSNGRNLGGTGLWLSPHDLARFGYSFLHNGRWDGQVIVPADWVQASTRSHIDATGSRKYGYQWWIPAFGGYAAEGWGGQYLYVNPEVGLVVVITAGVERQRYATPSQLVEFFILPSIQAAGALPANPAAASALQSAVVALAHPSPHPLPDFPALAAVVDERVYAFAPNAEGLESVSLDFREGEAVLTAVAAGQTFTAPIGLDGVYRLATEDTFLGPLTLARQGSWISADTFLLVEQGVGVADRLEYRFRYHDDRLTVSRRWWIEGYRAPQLEGTAAGTPVP